MRPRRYDARYCSPVRTQRVARRRAPVPGRGRAGKPRRRSARRRAPACPAAGPRRASHRLRRATRARSGTRVAARPASAARNRRSRPSAPPRRSATSPTTLPGCRSRAPDAAGRPQLIQFSARHRRSDHRRRPALFNSGCSVASGPPPQSPLRPGASPTRRSFQRKCGGSPPTLPVLDRARSSRADGKAPCSQDTLPTASPFHAATTLASPPSPPFPNHARDAVKRPILRRSPVRSRRRQSLAPSNA